MKIGFLGKTSIDEAVVAGISGSAVTVICNPVCETQSGCLECHSQVSCVQSKSAMKIVMDNAWTFKYHTGQRVYVEHLAVNNALAGIIVFGFPVAGAIAGYMLWNFLTGSATESVSAVLASLIGFCMGYALAAFIDRIIRRAVFPARIIGSIDKSASTILVQ